MPADEYQFVTQWRLPGTPEQVSDLLDDTDTLIRIWPSLYTRATVVEPGGENGIGRVLTVETRGHLPYTLRWSFRVTKSRHPYGYSIEAWGDMVGRGVWTFERDGDATWVTYDWRVRTEKPLLKLLSPILKPLFSANHDQVMADGEAALCAELERRRAATGNAPVRIEAQVPDRKR
jgi:Polyketide cyclase / dehydrase and lipid transport